MTKTCAICKIEKTINEFGKKHSFTNARYAQCRECKKQRASELKNRKVTINSNQ